MINEDIGINGLLSLAGCVLFILALPLSFPILLWLAFKIAILLSGGS